VIPQQGILKLGIPSRKPSRVLPQIIVEKTDDLAEVADACWPMVAVHSERPPPVTGRRALLSAGWNSTTFV
jgi:hypothetical protein